MITPEQIQLVQTSFTQCHNLAAVFYRRLFERDPSLRRIFLRDLRDQELKFTAMLDTIVDSLGNFDALVPQIRHMGSRHLMYGVKDSYYDTVKATLLSALEEQLGESFTSEVKEAWTAIYTSVATLMREAAAKDPFSRNI